MSENAVRGIATYLSSYTPRHSYRNTTQHGSCHSAMLQLMRCIVTILLIVVVCGNAFAQQTYYVFQHENGLGYLCNNNGTLGCSTELTASCVWVANNPLNNEYAYDSDRTLQALSFDGKPTYLNGANNVNNGKTSFGQFVSGTKSSGTESPISTVWHIDTGGFLCTTYDGVSSGGTKRYYTIYTADGTTFETKRDLTKNRFKTQPFDTNTFEGKTVSIPTISLADGSTSTISAAGQQASFNHADALSTKKYITFNLNGTDYYVDDQANATEVDPSTTDVTYTWTLEGIGSQFAEVSSDGVVTYKKLVPATELHAVLKCTATHNASGETNTATFDVTFTNKTLPVISHTFSSNTATYTITPPESATTAIIYYTTDGSDPRSSSTRIKYSGTFTSQNSQMIKAVAYSNGEYSDVATDIVPKQFVFMFNDGQYNFLQLDTSEGTLSNVTSLNSNCVFTRTGSTSSSTLKRDDYYLRRKDPNGNYCLYPSTSASYYTWTVDGNKLMVSDSGINRWLRFNGSAWEVSALDDDTNNEVIYKYYKVDDTSGLLNVPNITGATTISETGTNYEYQIDQSKTAYLPGNTEILIDNKDERKLYLYYSTWHYEPLNPEVQCVWTLSDNMTGYATVDSNTGVITYSLGIPAASMEATLTCTVTYNGATAVTTLPITFKNSNLSEKPFISCSQVGSDIMATITCETEGAEIYYTTDGSTPTTTSTKYSDSFAVSDGTVIKAISSTIGGIPSDVDVETAHFEYVVMFADGNNHYLMDNVNLGSSSIPTCVVNTFTPDNMVFTYSRDNNGRHFKTSSGNYLRSQSGKSAATNMSIGTYSLPNGPWIVDGNSLINIINTNYKLYYSTSKSNFQLSSSSNTYSGHTDVLYQYYPYLDANTFSVSDITGQTEINHSGTYTIDVDFCPAYYTFVANGTGKTYFYSKDNETWYNSPEELMGYTETWTLSWDRTENINDYARIVDGIVTYFNYLEGESSIDVTITCKVMTADGQNSTKTKKVKLVTPTTPVKPTISSTATSEGNQANVILSHPDDGVIIYYTTDGTTPTTVSEKYTGAFVADEGVTIKAIAVKGGNSSEVASLLITTKSGTANGTVTLYDYEDHNWIYYKGLDKDADYNTNYEGKIYNPEPRNVKIVYNGGGVSGASDVAVSGTESENQFVYYETLEKHVPSQWLKGDYPYQVIPNPFSKRPKKDDTYYGFNGWKIVSGAEYIKRASGKSAPVNNSTVLELDEVINFKSLPYPEVNYTSAEIVFEATWAEAEVIKSKTMPTFTQGYNSYERNFWIMTATDQTNYTYTQDMTVTAQSPDGGATIPENTGIYLGGTITIGKGTTKFEWIPIKNGNAINANGKNLYLGRGITMGTSYRTISGCSTNNGTVNQSLRVESGVYDNLYFYAYGSSSANINILKVDKLVAYIGCDYDRANNNNEKLKINGATYLSNYTSITLEDEVDETCTAFVKSGTFNANRSNAGTASAGQSLYYGFSNKTAQKGHRYLEIQGGELWNIAGGIGGTGNAHKESSTLVFRIKGGNIKGSIYGAGEYSGAGGSRSFVITGGKVKGWIAGGANGTQDSGGKTDGETYIYIGGNTRVDSEGSTSPINSALGGNVFGAGCGYSAETSAGEVTLGTNVVIADHAYIERGVYGGGAFGFTNATSNLYMLGGVVDGKGGGVNVSPSGTGSSSNNHPSYTNIDQGGFYGGASKNNGGTVNIKMYGGEIHTGIYGGSNVQGAIANSVSMQIDGGQVGTETTSANIHGGGYGQPTIVSGNVDITLGASGSEADSDGVTVYGDVYGGSALGSVNGTTAADTYHTNVTLNAGTIHGSLYGGALGSNDVAANVYGPVQVTVNGGKVVGENSAVYGCNNVNGAPQRAVSVIVNGTDSHNNNGTANVYTDDTYAINAVYGGGNQAAYTYGIPTVTVNNCDNSIGYVYGGGNQATVPATSVTIHGGNVIGNVFGGGNNAAVTGTATSTLADTDKGTRVNIDGGRILNVYGGNNNGGTITSSIKVNVAEPSTVACPVNIDDLYGGGNLAASNAGTITIGKCTNINRVFGGANQANVTGPINLSIVNGNIGTVFGGNNNSGTITGAINVTVNWDGTGNRSLGSVYGGGNLAEYNGNPTVNILNCTTTGSIFGGGLGVVKDADGKITKGAFVVGDPTVNIGDWDSSHHVEIGGNVFGGGDLAAVEGDPKVTVNDCGTLIKGDLYGGGNAAPVYSTNLTMWGGTVMGNVFGGGNGKDLTKNENGAQIGYKRDDSAAGGTGNAVAKIFGGTVGTWNGDECTAGGGIFGGSNTKGNVRGEVQLTIDQQKCADAASACDLKVKEIYGAGNEAAFAGTGIKFNLGCVSALSEIYGGAKKADLSGDVHLIISSGHFNKVFAGNNLGGNINGSIKVTIEETGCHPVIIDELYGGGNMAAYTTPSGKAQPEVNVISCTHIGQVFGGGYGKTAVVTGNPTVNINMIPGKFDPDKAMASSPSEDDNEEGKLGTIGTVFGGGNAANVDGNTNVQICTAEKVKLSSGDENYKDKTFDVKGVNITGNVYGGGNAADVTGKTNVTVGRQK